MRGRGGRREVVRDEGNGEEPRGTKETVKGEATRAKNQSDERFKVDDP